MRHLTFIFSLLACHFLCSSCIKDEPKNMECDVVEAWVEGDGLAQYFIRESDMRISDVPSGEERLTFIVRDLNTLPAMPVQFTLTPGATVSPANGSSQDFTNGPVTYTVTSEDGQWHRTYIVDFREATLPSNKYDFEDFELSANGHYYLWYYMSDNGSIERIWASGNEGYMIACPNTAATDYPTVPDENGVDGYCIKLTTRSTGSWGRTFKKPIAAGNFFLGAFDSQYSLTNTLKTTLMGIPYTKEPVKVTGYYTCSISITTNRAMRLCSMATMCSPVLISCARPRWRRCLPLASGSVSR